MLFRKSSIKSSREKLIQLSGFLKLLKSFIPKIMYVMNVASPFCLEPETAPIVARLNGAIDKTQFTSDLPQKSIKKSPRFLFLTSSSQKQQVLVTHFLVRNNQLKECVLRVARLYRVPQLYNTHISFNVMGYIIQLHGQHMLHSAQCAALVIQHRPTFICLTSSLCPFVISVQRVSSLPTISTCR